MVTDSSVIDSIFFDKHGKTLELIIYDMKSIVDADLQYHNQCMKEKVKAYVQAIENGQMYNLFELKKGKQYQYYIEVVIDQVPGQWYLDFLDWLDERITLYSNGVIRVRLHH